MSKSPVIGVGAIAAALALSSDGMLGRVPRHDPEQPREPTADDCARLEAARSKRERKATKRARDAGEDALDSRGGEPLEGSGFEDEISE